MSTAGEKLVRTAIRDRVFEPCYYLYGDEDYQKDDALRGLVDAAVDPATRDFNVEVLRGGDLDAETLGSIVGTPPMMAERRVVVIRDVHALKKDARTMLDKYLERPAPDLLLILAAPIGAKVDRGLASSCTAVEYEPLIGARIPKWITYYAQHDLKTEITPDAVTLLQEAVGTDLSQLKSELDKLGSYASGTPIDRAAVAAIVGVRPGETLGDFLDALARREAATALTLLPHVMQQPKTNAVTMVMALGTQMLGMGWALAAQARGLPPARLEGELFTFLKASGSAYTGRAWGEAVRSWAHNADRWTAPEIDAALDALLDADFALKESRLSSDEQIIANLVLALCGAPRRRNAA